MSAGRILAYVPDLMDRSKVAAAGGPAVRFVSGPAALEQEAPGYDLVLVDLTRPGVIDVLEALTATRVIGFANHTSRDAMAAARDAGVEQVMPRSEFFARIDELLS